MWLIALVAGVIAAMAGDSPVEVALRLAVPLLVANQWWVGLTGDATDKPADAITWTWTPRRVLVALGLARPGEHDLTTVNRERHIRAIATVSHRLHSTSWTWRRGWSRARLRRLAMNADDDMLDTARVRVQRVWQAADRTRPINAADRNLVSPVKQQLYRRLRLASKLRGDGALHVRTKLAAVAAAHVMRDAFDFGGVNVEVPGQFAGSPSDSLR